MQNEIVTTTQALPMDQHPAFVYLAGLSSERSRRVQKQALEAIADLLTGQPDLMSCNWSALRGTLKSAWLLGQMTADDYHRAASVQSVTGETIPAGRELQPGEIAALIATCENDLGPAGVRDAAIIALLYSCGLRRAEVTSLSLGDYDQESGKMVVNGKRNKQRTAYLVKGAARAMADWLEIRGNDTGPLFWPINKGGNLIPKRMTNQAIYKMLSKRGKQAKMAGHASVTTTARYDRRPEQAKQKAAGLLHVPYRGRRV